MSEPETPPITAIPNAAATGKTTVVMNSRLNVEDRAALVHSAILEDRAEVRSLKERISQTVVLLATASFGVSAYLLPRTSMGTAVLLDLAFLSLLWVAFTPLRRDLTEARKCLEFREDMLKDIGTNREPSDFHVYDKVPVDRTVRLDDKDMDSLARLAVGLIAAKMSALLILGPALRP